MSFIKTAAVMIFFLTLASWSQGATCPCYRKMKPVCTSVDYLGEGRCESRDRQNCQQCLCDFFGNEECELIDRAHYKFNGTANFCYLTEPMQVARCPSGTPPPPPVIHSNRTFCCNFQGTGSMKDFKQCTLPSWKLLPEAKHPFANLTRIFRTLHAKSDITFTLPHSSSYTVFQYVYNSVFNFSYKLDPELPPLFTYHQNPRESDMTLVPPGNRAQTVVREFDQVHEFDALYPGDQIFDVLMTWPKNQTVYEMYFAATIVSSSSRVATYDSSSCVTFEIGSEPVPRPI